MRKGSGSQAIRKMESNDISLEKALLDSKFRNRRKYHKLSLIRPIQTRILHDIKIPAFTANDKGQSWLHVLRNYFFSPLSPGENAGNYRIPKENVFGGRPFHPAVSSGRSGITGPGTEQIKHPGAPSHWKTKACKDRIYSPVFQSRGIGIQARKSGEIWSPDVGIASLLIAFDNELSLIHFGSRLPFSGTAPFFS